MVGITRKMTMLGAALLMSAPLFAQGSITNIPKNDYTRGWYIGAQAGMPMAESDFSSFGADKFRPGWSAGIHAGYRFTPVWSLEMTVNWGQQFLAEQDCCFERGYFLGSVHNRYHPDLIPAGIQGWYYKDLKSRTFVQRYGLQVNMNVLGVLQPHKGEPLAFGHFARGICRRHKFRPDDQGGQCSRCRESE